MNKEFRVWRFCHAENKHKFYYTSKPYIVCNSGATLVFPTDGNDEWVDDSIMEADEIPIQQFTGLTDLTGRKIFEGDIVQEMVDGKPAYFGQIVFNTGTFFISGDGPMFNYWDVDSAVPSSYKNHRIIGNIFENPELLK